MRKFLQKLKSNNGATGADVIVALSVLSIAMVVVSVIFVNMTNLNKQVNRTAGATRIVVNVMEAMRSVASPNTFTMTGDNYSYDFIEASIAGTTNRSVVKNAPNHAVSTSLPTATGARTMTFTNPSTGATTTFTLPEGYTLVLTFQGWPSNAEVDAVARIIVDCSFKVGEQTKHVSLSTGIARGAKATW